MAIIKKFRIKSYKKLNPAIEFENISISYGNRLILDNISFKINKNSIHGMLGPNGAGKSTIFNLITGLIKPNSGRIKIFGEDVTDYPIYIRTKKFKIAFVPQIGGFFNDLTLHENLKAISEIVIENKSLRLEKINFLISKFEFDALKNIKAKFLSGGQKKRLVIAMALLNDPKVLLLDEIYAALDVLTIKMLQETIVNLQQENQITTCICDHQARDLLATCDVAMILNNGKIGETYCIGGDSEKTNLQVVDTICAALDNHCNENAPHKNLKVFVKDRPGHDQRYAINFSKIKNELGWQPKYSFEEGMEKTVEWYLNNIEWCQNVTSGKYQRERLGI